MVWVYACSTVERANERLGPVGSTNKLSVTLCSPSHSLRGEKVKVVCLKPGQSFRPRRWWSSFESRPPSTEPASLTHLESKFSDLVNIFVTVRVHILSVLQLPVSQCSKNSIINQLHSVPGPSAHSCNIPFVDIRVLLIIDSKYTYISWHVCCMCTVAFPL